VKLILHEGVFVMDMEYTTMKTLFLVTMDNGRMGRNTVEEFCK